MKRTYMVPALKELAEELETELLGVSSDKGIGYGGVDNDGTKDPAGREDFSWDE
jgi:hypothetical protein